MRIPTLVACLVLLSCGGGGAPAPSPTEGAPAAGLPVLEGRPVLDVPIAAAPEPVRNAWRSAQALLADRAPAPDALKPWLERQVGRLKSVREVAAGGEAPLFSAILLGVLAEDLADQILAIPPPPEVAADPELARVFRETLEEQTVPLATVARDAYAQCAELAPTAAAVLRAWAGPCGEARDALTARIDRTQQAAAARPVLPRGPDWPPECADFEHADDPQAPAADPRAPLAIALVLEEDEHFRGKDRDRILAAVQERLAGRVEAPLVPRAEVARAEKLVRERRWSKKGPVCGQAPPLPALLTTKRPHLALATVTASCEEKNGTCTLGVWAYRVGSDDDSGLPAPMFATVKGDPAKLGSWLDAAARLGDDRPTDGEAGVLGMLSVGGPQLRVVGQLDDDPWLRIEPTLSEAREALTACVGDGAVASVAAHWRISKAGAISGVAATPVTGTDEVAQCVAAALQKTAWPCPRAGEPVDVDVTICLAK